MLMTAEQSLEVRVVGAFAAPAERVFDAWLDPEVIGKWMFGPEVRDEEIVRLKVDRRVGGSFSFAVRRQGNLLDHVGQYLELDRPRRLAFTWGVAQPSNTDSSRVAIEIVPLESGCQLSLVHQLHPNWADYASRTEAGWTKMLAALARAVDARRDASAE